MREGIGLYRGKRKDNGEWIEGSLLTKYDVDAGCVSAYYIVQIWDFAISVDFDTNLLDDELIEVIPETVGEFIGLPDKNDKKIFEGDIVKFGDIIGIINYNTGCYCGRTNKPDWRSRNNPAIDIIMNEYPNEIEVIGNIHDNPELLQNT